MRVFTALLGTETNTFSPFLTGFANFEQTYLVRHGAHGDQPFSFAVPLLRWRGLATLPTSPIHKPPRGSPHDSDFYPTA